MQSKNSVSGRVCLPLLLFAIQIFFRVAGVEHGLQDVGVFFSSSSKHVLTRLAHRSSLLSQLIECILSLLHDPDLASLLGGMSGTGCFFFNLLIFTEVEEVFEEVFLTLAFFSPRARFKELGLLPPLFLSLASFLTSTRSALCC